MFRFVCILALLGGIASARAEDARMDFEVREANGDRVFRLSDAKGKYVALHFLLKTECPYCIAHTLSYARQMGDMPDVAHVFLKPDTDEEISKWSGSLDRKNRQSDAEASGLPVIYRDPDAHLAKVFEIPFGYQFHGQEMHYPALVLLGPDGKEVFRYVGKSNRDRYAVEDFAEKIAALRKEKKEK